MFDIRPDDMDSPRKLTQSALQACELLGMYQAELARILRVNCGDIGKLAHGQEVLQPDSMGWREAQKYIALFSELYRWKQGDEVAMRHWLRAECYELGGVPLLIMVDELGIDEVLQFVQRRSS